MTSEPRNAGMIESEGETRRDSRRPLLDFKERLRLLHWLKSLGYYVHMHAFEYIVGDGSRFIAFIFIGRDAIEVYKLQGDAAALVESLRREYPLAKVNLYAGPVST